MKFDKERMLEQCEAVGGTGKAAQRAKIRPDDMQMAIWGEEISSEIGEKLVATFGEGVRLDCEPEKVIEDLPVENDAVSDTSAINLDMSIDLIKEAVKSGEYLAADVYTAESLQEDPRSTLLSWLEKECDVEG